MTPAPESYPIKTSMLIKTLDLKNVNLLLCLNQNSFLLSGLEFIEFLLLLFALLFLVLFFHGIVVIVSSIAVVIILLLFQHCCCFNIVVVLGIVVVSSIVVVLAIVVLVGVYNCLCRRQPGSNNSKNKWIGGGVNGLQNCHSE